MPASFEIGGNYCAYAHDECMIMIIISSAVIAFLSVGSMCVCMGGEGGREGREGREGRGLAGVRVLTDTTFHNKQGIYFVYTTVWVYMFVCV